jgi:hypothetical protein
MPASEGFQMEQRQPPGETPEPSARPHFVDDRMCQIIRARIVELYDSHGLAAFRFPGVQKAIDLLLDAGEGEAAIRRSRRGAEAGGGRPLPG